jgi:transposase
MYRYLEPPGGTVVLSIAEKTRIWALDRTQSMLPIEFVVTENRTHDYLRHGITNLFAALNVGTGEVFGECKPTRDGADFLAFLRKAVRGRSDTDIHVVLDTLSTHTTPDVGAWLERNPHVHLHFTPSSSWINHIETWPGIITRKSIRRGSYTSVTVLMRQTRDYITHWNIHSRPFTWTASADEILAKVQLVQTNINKLVDNNTK